MFGYVYKVLGPLQYVLKYFCLNVICFLIPHPKLRAGWLKLLGAKIGKDVRIENVQFVQIQWSIKNLHCGDAVFIGAKVVLDLSSRISIGSNTGIAPGCTLMTHFDATCNNCGVSKLYPKTYKPIIIHDNVAIGADTTILAGSEIERFSVIGAKSLVNGRVPSGTLVCGIPAKVKKVLN